MSRTVAILSGGDWTDAAVDLLDVPADLDLDAARERWQQWYRLVFKPARDRGEREPYLDFPDWLIQREGATRADIEEYEA